MLSHTTRVTHNITSYKNEVTSPQSSSLVLALLKAPQTNPMSDK